MRKILTAPLIGLVPFLLSACANPGMQGGSNAQLQQAINTVGAMINGTVPTPVAATSNNQAPTAQPTLASGEGTPKLINGTRIIIDGPRPKDPRWAGKTIESTPLYKIFDRNPLQSRSNLWPRISIRLDDYSESLALVDSSAQYGLYGNLARPLECIKFTAVIWTSEKKSQKVDGVVMCSVDIKDDDRYMSIVAMRHYGGSLGPHMYTSEQVRTAGPLIPRRLVPQSTSEDAKFYLNAQHLLSSLFIKTGFQGPIDGDARLWFINLTNAKF
jgi:hypothetical protein